MEDGCCAADCEDELALCSSIDDGDKCQKLSSCHWKPGKKADCSWKSNDEPQDPGCCVAKSDKVDSEWFEKCPQFWNEDKCDKKDKNCKWVPCDEEDDCTKYWPQLQFEGHAEVALFGEIMTAHSSEMHSEWNSTVSLATVLAMFVAALVMHRVYDWWSRRGDGDYEKLDEWGTQSTSHQFYDSM